MSSADLYQNQNELYDSIKKIGINIKKDGWDRKNPDYFKRRMAMLENLWSDFQFNHDRLSTEKSVSHPYFANDCYSVTLQCYNEVKELILQQHQQLTTLVRSPREQAVQTKTLEGENQQAGEGTSHQTKQEQEALKGEADEKARHTIQDKEPSYPPQQEQQNSVKKDTGSNSKLDDMMRKQTANFKAFMRAVANIHVEFLSEKWEFQDALLTLQTRWSAIDNLHWEIECETNGEKMTMYEERYTRYENQFHELKKALNTKMWSGAHREKTTPKLEIPVFYGSYNQWIPFKDLFTEAIHNNNSLSPAQKMQFLKSKVQGEAERLIQHLQISSDNYLVCWDILNHRYNNEKLIFTSHINRLFNLPNMQQQSMVQIKKMHDVSIECLHAIRNLGVNIDTWDPILVHILTQKLDADTHSEYNDSLKNCRNLPILKDLLDFLEAKFTSLETSRRKQEMYELRCTLTLGVVAQVSELYRSSGRAGMRLALVFDFKHAPPMTPRGLFREAMLLDLACPRSELILEQASAARAFNYRYSWLLLHNSSSQRSTIEATVSASAILPDADVVWSSPETLVDVYSIKPGMPYLQTVFGVARNSSRQELQALWGALPSVVSRRKDLRNVSMKGISVVTKPESFKSWWDLRDRQIDTFPKFTYPLMMLLTQDMNFRFDLRQVDVYGVVHNGTFDGLVGRLQRQEAELGIGSIFIRSDRMQAIDFISETCALTCAFIFRQPSRSAVSNVFLAPFSAGVWAACGGVAAAAALLLVALRKVRGSTRPGTDLQQFTLPETFTFALGTLCQQGFYSTPAVTSVRLVMFSTLLAALFVFTAYSAKIVAILQTPSDALRTIDDLTRSPMLIGVQDTTYKKVYFLESPDESTQQLYRRKILPQGERAYLSEVEGIARVRTGFFAFQVERSSGYDIIKQTFTEREKCSLKEIEAFKLPMVAVPMRKHSGYRELFASRLRWQREVGLMDRARRMWLEPRPRCESSGGGFVSIGIIDVLPALQVLAMGALISVLLLAIELGLHVMNKKTRKYHHTHQLPRGKTMRAVMRRQN